MLWLAGSGLFDILVARLHQPYDRALVGRERPL